MSQAAPSDTAAPSWSIDPADVARFSAIAAEWWDPKGKFAPLHKFNPTRLAFIREQALVRFGRDARARKPFEGLTLLDIGCGGGLLSEPMSRLGFTVTAVDASEKNIKTAAAHAAEQGLEIGYRPATAEQLLA
jgi:2-polyprenyl-6-hydroxyphenyl methylase/3-demethylubiquinone-9 3-methyltransferase